jgi:hypothetical protein
MSENGIHAPETSACKNGDGVVALIIRESGARAGA